MKYPKPGRNSSSLVHSLSKEFVTRVMSGNALQKGSVASGDVTRVATIIFSCGTPLASTSRTAASTLRNVGISEARSMT